MLLEDDDVEDDDVRGEDEDDAENDDVEEEEDDVFHIRICTTQNDPTFTRYVSAIVLM